MKYIFLYENYNLNYNNDGFIINHDGWKIKYNHNTKHDIIKRFDKRKKYEINNSNLKEINLIVKIIIEYLNNNFTPIKEIAFYIKSKSIYIITNTDIMLSYLFILTFLDPDEMKVKKNTKIINI